MSNELARETVRQALYEGLAWFGTLPEPEGDIPERYHRWKDLGEFADRILAALRAAEPSDEEVERAFLAVMNAQDRELSLPLTAWAERNLLKRRIAVAIRAMRGEG